MKNFLPLILIILFSYNLKAQITINSIDLQVGDVVLQAVDTNFQTDLLSPGTDLNWDFSGIHGQRTDTIAPLDPSTTNHASAFPDANLAFGSIELAMYVANTPNEYVSLGVGGYVAEIDAEVEVVLTDPDSIIDFPINYGDARDVDSWGQTYTNVQGNDVRVSMSVARTQVCDAWGTVTTPHDSYEVLRIQEVEISIDSVFAVTQFGEFYQESYSTFDTTYKYNFYTNDPTIKYPLLEVKYDHVADTIFETKWITFMPDNTPELSSNLDEISIYPNPSSNVVNINTTDVILSVNIINIQGKIVKSSTQKSIQVSDLPSALYIIEIKTEKNIIRKRLIIE